MDVEGSLYGRWFLLFLLYVIYYDVMLMMLCFITLLVFYSIFGRV